MSKLYKSSLVWLRRDLRVYDNAALFHALESSEQVFPVFIFDPEILNRLENKEDRRVEFIWESINELKESLNQLDSDIIVRLGNPIEEIPKLCNEFSIDAVFCNKDYEDYAVSRDENIKKILKIDFLSYKDQVIFEEKEILTGAEKPYTVFSPYRNNHLKKIEFEGITQFDCESNKHSFAKFNVGPMISLEALGFNRTNLKELNIKTGSSGGIQLIKDFESRIQDYKLKRDFPAIKGVSYLSVHNRFGTVSIRHLARVALKSKSQGHFAWLNELIWRDFYFQILSNFPYVNEGKSFKSQFDQIKFENNEAYFEAWKKGETGFPIIDAAMHQLNQTGFMHNRLRMIVASFLVKDLLIDWRWGEKYFADNLIDFDFAANNGGWQWAASTGCDAQPWFRIFNPILQSEKFDPEGKFIKRYLPALEPLNKKQIHAPWIAFEKEPLSFPILLGKDYPNPIVSHKDQREKALKMYDLKNVA